MKKSKLRRVRKVFDIDIARSEKEAELPYILWGELFIDYILPYLRTIDPNVRLDATDYEQKRLQGLLAEAIDTVKTRFNLEQTKRQLRTINQNLEGKAKEVFVKELEDKISVKPNQKNMRNALGSQKVQSKVQSMLLSFAASLNDITERSTEQTSLELTAAIEQNLTGMNANILNRVAAGERWESIAKEIMGTIEPDKENISRETEGSLKKIRNKAKFIARNAASTTIGLYDKKQHQSAGIEIYMWQTAEDERVRPTHEHLDQEVFAYKYGVTAPTDISFGGSSYSKGETIKVAVDPAYKPGITFPGEPWNCRCVSIPLIPGIDYDFPDEEV